VSSKLWEVHNNVKEVNKLNEPTSISLDKMSADDVVLFGSSVSIPMQIMTLDSVTPSVRAEVTDLKCGDEIEVELVPQKGFKCTISYKSE